MHIVMERIRPTERNVTEIICYPRHQLRVRQAIFQVTGHAPVRVEVEPGEVLFITDQLTMEEGLAILQLVVDQARDPMSLSRQVLTDYLETRRLLVRLRERYQIDSHPIGLDGFDYAESDL